MFETAKDSWNLQAGFIATEQDGAWFPQTASSKDSGKLTGESLACSGMEHPFPGAEYTGNAQKRGDCLCQTLLVRFPGWNICWI